MGPRTGAKSLGRDLERAASWAGVFVVAVVVVIQLIVTLWEFWAPSVAV